MENFKSDILDVPTLAKLLNRCPMTVYRYLKSKDPIPGFRVGGKYLFFREEVEKWIRGRK